MLDHPWRFLTTREAATYLGFQAAILKTMRKEGRGPKHHVLPNGTIRYRLADLEEWALSGKRECSRNAKRIVSTNDPANVIAFPGSGVRVMRPRPVLKVPKPSRPKRVRSPERREAADGE